VKKLPSLSKQKNLKGSGTRQLAQLRRFLKENHDLPRMVDGIVIGFQPDADDYLWMSIGIPEDITQAAIKRAIPTIINWRERLTNFQGRSVHQTPASFYERLWRLHKIEGESHWDIAKRLNRELEVMLVRCYKTIPWSSWEKRAAQDLLKMMGFTVSQIKEIWEEAMNNLASGHHPIDPNYPPITRDHVITRLRAWKPKRRPAK